VCCLNVLTGLEVGETVYPAAAKVSSQVSCVNNKLIPAVFILVSAPETFIKSSRMGSLVRT
jgi:hypothetical protein